MPANAGPYSGNDGAVLIAANVIAKVTNFNYTESLTTRDQTVLGDAYEQPAAGLKAVSGNVTAWLDRSDTNGQEALDSGASVTLILRHGAATDDPTVTITALITSKNVTQGDGNSTVEVSFDFVGTGATPYVEGLIT